MRKKLFIPVIAFVIALGMYGMAAAQGQHADHKGKDVTLTGYITDKHCEKNDGATHDVNCIVAGPCGKSGLGVFADGKFHAFDAKGSEEAIKILKASGKAGVKYKVTGTESGETLTVKSIEAVKS